MKQLGVLGLPLFLMLAACGAPASLAPPGGGMGMGGGMHARHGATIPADYSGRSNPVAADDESLERGARLYAANCAVCHGDGGMGDGPSAAGLEPAPAPIAHTSQMLGDDYLFWRVSEGGVPFSTAMPVWKELLDEQARWDVINYVRALGQGLVQPGSGMGGALFDPAVKATQRAAMLVQAVEQNVLTAAEAETFNTVHPALDAYRAAHPVVSGGSSPAERQATMLAELVKTGAIVPAQSEVFLDVHNRLIEAGLME